MLSAWNSARRLAVSDDYVSAAGWSDANGQADPDILNGYDYGVARGTISDAQLAALLSDSNYVVLVVDDLDEVPDSAAVEEMGTALAAFYGADTASLIANAGTSGAITQTAIEVNRARLWRDGISVAAGETLYYQDSLYESISAHTASGAAAPDATPATYATCNSPLALNNANMAALFNRPLFPGTRVVLGETLNIQDMAEYLTVKWRGSADAPVVLSGPGTIRGALYLPVLGQYVRIQDVEILFDGWETRLSTSGAYPPDDLPENVHWDGLIEIDQRGTEVRRCAVNNGSLGVGFWNSTQDVLVDECHIWHNGYRSNNPVSLHGEGVYGQGTAGTRVVRGSVVHDNGDHTIAAYSTSPPINNFHVIDNTLFNDPFQFGGQKPMTGGIVSDNLFYANDNIVIGYSDKDQVSVTLRNNLFAMAEDYFYCLRLQKWQTLSVQNNVIVGNKTTHPVYVQVPPANWSDWTIDYNDYYLVPRVHARPDIAGASFYIAGYGSLTFEEWQALTGWDTHSTLTWGLPPNSVHIRLSQYADAAHVTIYNWTKAASVSVNLGDLPHGDYRATNAQNVSEYFDFAWAGSPVTFAMTGWTNGEPQAWGAPLYASAFPQFGCFLVEAAS